MNVYCDHVHCDYVKCDHVKCDNVQYDYAQCDYTVQQILDDWMLWIIEYTVFMFFGPQNPKIILKFIG